MHKKKTIPSFAICYPIRLHSELYLSFILRLFLTELHRLLCLKWIILFIFLSSSTSLLLVFILLQKNFRELFYFHFETKKIWTIVHHTAIDSWSLFKYIETSQSKHTIANIQSAMQMNIYTGCKKMKWAEENKNDGRRMVWVSGALVHQLALCLGNKPCVECVYGKMKLKLFHIFTIHIPLLALSAPRLQFALSLVSTARMPRS